MNSKPSNVNNFRWIELAGFTPDKKMLRNEFVPTGDKSAIEQWKNKFNNTDVFSSISIYEKPDFNSDFIAPLFFDIDSPGDLMAARESTLVLCELITDRLKIDSDQIQICFSGSKGYHVTVPCEIFNPSSSNSTLELYKKMAINAQAQGVRMIDISVYTNRRLWRFVNSINGKSGRYKIPISQKELLNLDSDNLKKLAEQPRPEFELNNNTPIQHAVDWYKKALSCMQNISNKQNIKINESEFKTGWRTPVCIKNIQQNVLPDGIRHNAYLALARFYSWINMHPLEAIERINLLDGKNPIDNPNDIERIIKWAVQNPGFPGCNNQILKKYCNEKDCFYYSLKSKKNKNEKV